jgi:hypothetical protein
LGLQVLKSWSKFGHRIFGLSICFQHFFWVMRRNFRLDVKNYDLHFKHII